MPQPSWIDRFAAAGARLWNRLTRDARYPGQHRVFVGRTPAGVWVDADSALKNATVWACISYLSSQIAQLPWRVGRQSAGGGFAIAATHPADWLLYKRPNPEMGAFSFRQTLMSWVLRHGNAYAEIEWDLRGAPAALWPIHPDRVKPDRDEAGKLFYRVWNAGGGYVDVPPEDMFHVRGLGDGPVGLSVIAYAAESIGWARATEIFGATFFGEGMNPTVVLKTEKSMSPAAVDEARARMKRLYAGPKGERTFVADAGMSVEKLAYTPEDGQFIETRQHQVEEICRWFRTPPHKVMHLLRATFSNIEQQSIEVVVDSIMPWVKVFEDEADYKLLPARSNLATKLNLKGLLRGDSAARAKYYQALFGTGAMSINDILSAEDENPIGPQGDVRFVSVNYQTLQQAIEGKPAPTGGAVDPAAEPDGDEDAPPAEDDPPDPAANAVRRRLNGHAPH